MTNYKEKLDDLRFELKVLIDSYKDKENLLKESIKDTKKNSLQFGLEVGKAAAMNQIAFDLEMMERGVDFYDGGL